MNTDTGAAPERPSAYANRTPDEIDAQVESVVLGFLLYEHPNQLTVAEIAWALHHGSIEFDREDAVERAVCELVGAGLLHCQGGFILPTRAATYFARLELG